MSGPIGFPVTSTANFDTLTPREWASLFWLTVLVVWIVTRRDLRPACVGVVKAAAQPSLVACVVVLVGYVWLVVLLADAVGLWDSVATWMVARVEDEHLLGFERLAFVSG